MINLTVQPSQDSGNVPFKKFFKYADYASSVTVTKSAKIMLGFPNYAKNYARTIYNGLLPGWGLTMFQVANAADIK